MLDWLRHIVVLTQENRSFDQMFGHLAGADGIPAGVCLPARRGPCVTPHPAPGFTPSFGPPHSWKDTHRAWDRGAMDGFAIVGGRRAMTYETVASVTGYVRLAHEAVLLDHFFSSVLGPTFPNHLYAISGTSSIKNDPPLFGHAAFHMETVFDQLERRGVSWKYYVGWYARCPGGAIVAHALQLCPLLWFPRFMKTQKLRAKLAPYGEFFDDVRRERLPAVAFLSPGGFSSGHPPLPLTWSASALSRLVSALRKSPAWPSTLLVCAFDEAGGFYDHVPPPVLDAWGPGVRVPCLLFSGRLTPGVDHGSYDHTSILRLIEERHGLPLLGERTKRMPSLATALPGAV